MSLGRSPRPATVHRWGREELLGSIKIALTIAVLQYVIWVLSTSYIVSNESLSLEAWAPIILGFVGGMPALLTVVVLLQRYETHGVIGVGIYTAIASGATYLSGSLAMTRMIVVGAGIMTFGMLVIILIDAVAYSLRAS